jgi:hypothetical protein
MSVCVYCDSHVEVSFAGDDGYCDLCEAIVETCFETDFEGLEV